MAFTRTTYGVEFNPQQQPEEPHWLGWLVAIILIAAVLSLSVRFVRSLGEQDDLPPEVPRDAESRRVDGNVGKSEPAISLPPPKVVEDPNVTAIMKRPANVRNLLMRLKEAERMRDVEMEVTTIEQIRALPGAPAADIDDDLARRLGELNIIRLFIIRNGQWVAQVVVKRGDSASRIAAEHGSTLASMERLNGRSLDSVQIGQKLFVMNHPRFNLVVHRRLCTADLQLNGKFFRRYDLVSANGNKNGPYETGQKARKLFQVLDIKFKPDDLDELECLLPKGSSVLVSEL